MDDTGPWGQTGMGWDGGGAVNYSYQPICPLCAHKSPNKNSYY